MNNPNSDAILKNAIQTINDGKYARTTSDWKQYSTSQIFEMVIADHNDSLERDPKKNSHADFTDGTDAKTGSLSIKVNKSGTYSCTIAISGTDKKFGHIRGLFSDNREEQVHALVIDKHYLQNDKEKWTGSFNKFGDYCTFSIEDMIERSSEWFDAEFQKRHEALGDGRPEVSSKIHNRNITPEVTVESLLKEIDNATREIITNGLSLRQWSKDDIRLLLKKVA